MDSTDDSTWLQQFWSSLDVIPFDEVLRIAITWSQATDV